MSALRQIIGRIGLQLLRKNHVVGWSMTPEEAVSFIKGLGKTVLTFYGYSGMGYEDEKGMLQIARGVLSRYSPQTTLVIIGATEVGVGAVYPIAKSMGFETAGIVTTKALEYPEDISGSVDHLCFVKDNQYGGDYPTLMNSPPHPEPWWIAVTFSSPSAGTRSASMNCSKAGNRENSFTISLRK